MDVRPIHGSSGSQRDERDANVGDWLIAVAICLLILAWQNSHKQSADFAQRPIRDFTLAPPNAVAQSPAASLDYRETGRGAVPPPAHLSLIDEYQSSPDLYGFYLKYSELAQVGFVDARYPLSQALEECFSVSRMNWEEYFAEVRSSGWTRETLACQGFVNRPIRASDIVELLASSAAAGDPRARARMLLFRDIGASMAETQDLVAELLATQDPYVIRDVEAYMGRAQLEMIASSKHPVDAAAERDAKT